MRTKTTTSNFPINPRPVATVRLALLFASLGLAWAAAAAPVTVWVDDDYSATGANDGHTWAVEAFATLQAGVDAVADGGTIRIAPGTYTGAVCSKSVRVKSSGPGVVIKGASPAWTQDSGIVDFDGQTFTVASDDPTILVNGGTLTMLNCTIDESSGYDQVAIKVVGGTIALTPGNTLGINGAGSFIRNQGTNPVAATGNTWKQDGTTLTSNFTIEDGIFHALDAGGGGLVTWVANNVYVTASSGAIRRGISAAGAGFTVNIGPGTFTEVGQLLISSNLTIVGSGVASTTVKPSADTGSSGDSRGWWLVDAGIDLNLSQMTLDGTGYQIWQGIRHKGVGTIEQVKFIQIQYEPSGASYAGTAVAAFGGVGAVDISDCSFEGIGRVGVLYYGAGTTGAYSGNTYTGKGTGNWLDYAVEVGAGAVATVTNSTVTACTGVAASDGSTSAGVLVTSYFGAGTRAKIVDNTLIWSTSGIAVGYDGSDTSLAFVQGNNLTANSTAGMTITGGIVDAGQVGGSDLTGFGASTGDNDFTGYVADNAAPWAIENSGTNIVLAFNNHFGNFANVRDVIWDGVDAPPASAVGYSELAAAYATAPASVTVQCIGEVPAGATGLAAFLAQGGVLSATVANSVSFIDGPLTPGPAEGSFTRSYTLVDLAGQTATCSQIITVDDMTPPTITCPPNVTVNTDPGLGTASGVSLGTPVTGDNCAVASVGNDAPSTFPVGTTTVTWTVTDSSGLTATCAQTVTVVDNQPPTALCQDITVPLDATGHATITAAQVDNGSTDNCDIASTTVNPSTLTFCDLPSRQVTLTVTDVHSNVSTCTATVTLTAPPTPSVVYVDASYPGACQAVDWPYTGAGDKLIGFNAFSSLQAAIGAVASGGTVNVAAGTYSEAINIENRNNLTIEGVGRDSVTNRPAVAIDWGLAYGSSRKTAIRVVNSDNFTLRGITLDCDLIKGDNRFGFLYWNSSGGVFEANRFMNMSRTNPPYYDMMGYLRGQDGSCASRDTVTIRSNEFIDTGRVGLVAHDYLHLVIEGNLFEKTTDAFGYGMEIGSASTAEIRNNIIRGFDFPAPSDNSASGGIYVENCFTTGVPSCTKNVLIEDNEIYGCQQGMVIGNEFFNFAGPVGIVATIQRNNIHNNTDAGILLADADDSLGSSVTVQILNNDIHNNGAYGIYAFTGSSDHPTGGGTLNINVANCSITGHPVSGFELDELPSSSTYSVSLSQNDLSANGAGLNNLVATATVNAESNWWGSASGPANGLNPGGTGVALTGNADFSPWLGEGTDTGVSLGFQPNLTPVHYSPHHLVFSTQPGGAPVNSPLAPQPVVQVIDEIGGLAVAFNGSVSVAIGNNPSGGTLAGATSVLVINGTAAFSDLSVDKAGAGYTLAASSASPILGPTSDPFEISNVLPVIASLDPSWKVAGDAGFALTVNGSGFVFNSVVRWNGADRATTYLSPSQLTIAVTAGDIASVGSANVSVFNPAPGGGESVPAVFEIKAVPTVVWVDDNYTSGGGNDGHLWGYDAFTSIQAGVNRVAAGGTVHVGPGTYDETVALSKTVALVGPQAGVAGYDASRPVAGGEAIITGSVSHGGVQVMANEVVVDGFVIEQVDSGYSVGVWLSSAKSGAHIDNNIIRDNTMGLYLAGEGTNPTLIRRNLFLANNRPGPASGDAIYGDTRMVNVLVGNNKFVGNNSGSMVLVSSIYGSFGPVSLLTVSSNVFVGKGPGISGQTSFYTPGALDTVLRVTDNTFDGGDTTAIGLRVVGVDDAVIARNTMSGYTNTALDIQYLSTRVTIENNELTNNERGVFVRGWMLGSDVTVRDNSITASSIAGVENLEAEAWPEVQPVNASGNWWGDSTLAGVQAKLVGTVDFTPWLDAGTDTSVGNGFQGDFSLLHVAAASPQVGTVGRVQEGVNLIADGALAGADRVVDVKAGAYVEDLVIGQSVKLLGPNAGVAGCGVRTAEGILYPATQDVDFGRVIDVAADHVTIDGLEINGDNPGLSGGRTMGTADADTSTGIQNGEFVDPDYVVGEFQVQHVTIQNNVFRNFTWDGVYIGEVYGTTNGWIVVRNNKFQNQSEGAQFYAVHADFSDNCATDSLRLVGMHQVSGVCDAGFTPRIANNTLEVSSDVTVWEARGPGFELPGRDTGLWVNGRQGSAPPLVVSSNIITVPSVLPTGATFWGMIGWQVHGDRQLSFANNTVNGNGYANAGFIGWGLQGTVPVTLTGGALSGLKDVGVRAVNRHDFWGDASTAITLDGVPITLTSGAVGAEAYDDPAAAAGFTSSVTVKGNTSITGGAAGVVATGADASATVINNFASITGNGVGIDVNGGKALVESNDLTSNTIAAIRVQNGGIVDAGDCAGSNVTGLGTGSGANGSSAGENNLTGYLSGSAKAVINDAGTALAYNNAFGAAPGQDIQSAFTGSVSYSQSGGVLVNSPLPPISVQCAGEVPAAATDLAGFIALGGVASCGSATVSHSDSPLSPGTYEGTVTRTYTLTDTCGQSATCIQVITVDDTIPPTITSPANVTVNADPGQCHASGVQLGTPTTNDNCSVASVNNNAPAQFPVGTNIVTWIVTDLSGLTGTNFQTVTVLDVELPIVTCPAPIVVTNEPGLCGAAVNFLPTATDNCGVAGVVATPPSGSFFAVGVHTVNVVATDIHGNATTCDFTVTVNDVEPPSALCPANIVQAVDAGQSYATVTFTLPASSDNCAVAGTVATPASGSTFPVGTNSITVVATDVHGNTNACSFTVAVIALPAITAQPLSRTNYAGTTATFTVSAESPAPLSYQWQKDGAALSDGGNVSGASSTSLSVADVTDADEAAYTVVVSNLAGSVTSDAATLTVFNPPIIVVQPQDRTNNAGSTATFTVELATNSTPPFAYQWFKNGTNALTDGANVSGAITDTLTLSNVLAADEGEYSVTISNEVAVVTSSNAVLTVIDPFIVSHPTPVTAPLGSPVSFSVTTAGTEPFSYQWQWEGIDLPGENASTLNLAGIVDTDAGEYSVVVENAIGVAISESALLSITHPPVITAQPASQMADEGNTVIFEVSANGTIPFSYQWKKNGFDLSGQNSRQLVLTAVTPADQGSYAVVVSNADGVTNSASATLTVIVPPAITMQPVGLTNDAGLTAVFSVTVAGSPAVYSWYLDGTNLLSDGVKISGASSNVLTVMDVLGADAGVYSFMASNHAGVAVSSNTLLVVHDPIITTQPTNLIVNLGQPASFTVEAYGTAPTWQWRKEGAPINGATSPTLDISSATADDAGQYDVIVSNQYAVVTSEPVTLAVTLPPTITVEPVSLVRNAGQSAVFTVTVSGTAPFSYQWKKNGSEIDGRTTDTLTLLNVSQTDAASYTVLVSNPAGEDLSVAATLMVIDAPVITEQPSSRTNEATTTASFSVTATGTPPVYQWFKDGIQLVDGGNVSGATSNVLTLVYVLGADRGNYSVVLSNAAGVVSSSDAALVVIDPAILAQPLSRTNVTGGTVAFSVTAAGSAPLSYQWRQDGGALFGKTASTLILTNISSSDAGAYTVVITNSSGSITSAPAYLVTFPPLITTQPASLTVNQGQPASFNVSATGQSPFSYQWQKNAGGSWTNVPNATNRIFTIGSAQAADAGNYQVIVSNPLGSETSQPATLTVIVPPAITSHPASQIKAVGATVIFNVGVAGTAPFHYQWKKGSVEILNETNAALVLTGLSAADATTYSVVVTNPAGMATSLGATLTVVDSPRLTMVSYVDGNATISLNGTTDYRYAIQASTDFSSWLNLHTNTAPYTFTDTNAGGFEYRFYRAVFVP